MDFSMSQTCLVVMKAPHVLKCTGLKRSHIGTVIKAGKDQNLLQIKTSHPVCPDAIY